MSKRFETQTNVNDYLSTSPKVHKCILTEALIYDSGFLEQLCWKRRVMRCSVYLACLSTAQAEASKTAAS